MRECGRWVRDLHAFVFYSDDGFRTWKRDSEITLRIYKIDQFYA